MENICVFLASILPGASVDEVLQESRLAQRACVAGLTNVPPTVINSCSSAAISRPVAPRRKQRPSEYAASPSPTLRRTSAAS
eukprot:11055693-Heterocapsa_arctica.AAC.1